MNNKCCISWLNAAKIEKILILFASSNKVKKYNQANVRLTWFAQSWLSRAFLQKKHQNISLNSEVINKDKCNKCNRQKKWQRLKIPKAKH